MLRGLGVTIVLAVASGGEPVVLLAYAATVAVLQLCWTSFQRSMSRAIATRPAMAVRNIGQELELRTFYARARRRAANAPSVLHVTDLAVVAGMALALATPQPGLVAVLVAVVGAVAMVGFAAFARRWSDRFRASGRVERYERQLQAQLEAFDPQVIVHVSAGTSQTYMFNQWMDAFNAVPQRLLFLVREATHLSRLGATHWPVIYATRTRDVERFVLPNVRIAFYAANGGKNVHLLREAGVKHVFLNHGDSDKSSSANPVTRVYNELWVAGPAAVDRYEAAGIDIPRSSFAIVGRPQVDGMTAGLRRSGQPPRVLYAPTWEGAYEESNYSSLEVMGVEIVRRIIAERPDWGIVFKPHPATGKQRSGILRAKREVEALLRDAPNAERHLLAGPARMSVYDCFHETDVLISDISSVVTDFLVTDRPVLVSNPKGLPVDEYLRLFPSQRASYLVDAACESLLPMLDLALGDDPLAAERRAMRAYLHGEHPHGPLQTFRDHITRLYDRAEADARAHRSYFKFADHTVASASG
ncbi:MAG: CDP-glycerol glycerophosphotransferase family protein, partial [Actinomycetota bacterium]|nr:CDP-glycerol glycerophosphotransferase family protein [Actinomycetota bacterium]